MAHSGAGTAPAGLIGGAAGPGRAFTATYRYAPVFAWVARQGYTKAKIATNAAESTPSTKLTYPPSAKRILSLSSFRDVQLRASSYEALSWMEIRMQTATQARSISVAPILQGRA